MSQRGFKIRALGEIAIRCRDLAAMVAFYRDMLGLEILPGDYPENIVFFRISRGYGGHTAVLALFAEPAAPQQSSLHHLALSLGFIEQEAALEWFRAQGVDCRVEIFAWIGWRGLFVTDPEGNRVELVAFDESLLK